MLEHYGSRSLQAMSKFRKIFDFRLECEEGFQGQAVGLLFVWSFLETSAEMRELERVIEKWQKIYLEELLEDEFTAGSLIMFISLYFWINIKNVNTWEKRK